MLIGGEPAGLRRWVDEVMVPLFWARPVPGPGAGRWPAGRGAVVAGGGAGRRLAGRVASVRESSYSADRGEGGRGEQDVVEAAGGAGPGGVGDRGAGAGRDHGGYPG